MNVKIGDRIRIKKGCYPYFQAGDTGTVTEIEEGGTVWAEMVTRYRDHGPWCVATDEHPVEDYIEVIE